jgi:hypothetical protein
LLKNSLKWRSLVAVRLSAAIALISFGLLAKRISTIETHWCALTKKGYIIDYHLERHDNGPLYWITLCPKWGCPKSRSQIRVPNRGFKSGPKSGSQIRVPNRGHKSGSQIGVPNRGPKSGSQIRVPNRGPKSGSQIGVSQIEVINQGPK